MADLQTTVDLIFRGVDQTGGLLDKLGKDAGNFGDKIGQATAPITDFTGKVFALQGAAIALGGYLVGKGISAFSDYEQSVNELQKQFSGTPEEFEDFTLELKALGQELGASGTQINTFAADWLKAGKDTEEAIGLTRLAFQAVVGLGLDYETTIKNFKKITETFSLDVGELETALDDLNTVVDNTASSPDELIDAISRAGGAASGAGFNFQELLATLTPAVAQFQEGEPVGRAFTTVLSKMVSPTGEVAALLDDLGIATKDADGNLRPAKDTLFEFLAAVQPLPEPMKNLAAVTLAGADQFSRFAGIIAGYPETTKILGGEIGEQRRLVDEFNIALSEIETKADQFKNAVGAIFVAIGANVSESFKDLLDAAKGFALELGSQIDKGSFDAIFDALNDGFNSVADFLRDATANLPDVLEDVDFSGFANAIDKLFSVFEDTEVTTESVTRFVEAVGSVAEAVANFTVTVIEVLGNVGAALAPYAETFANLSPEAAELIGILAGGAVALAGAGLVFTAVSNGLAALAALTGLLAPFAAGAGLVTASLGPLTAVIGALAAVLYADKTLGIGEKLNDILVPDWLAGYQGATIGTAIADAEETVRGWFGFLRSESDSGTAPLRDAVQNTEDQITNFMDKVGDLEVKQKEADFAALVEEFERTGRAADLTREEFDRLLDATGNLGEGAAELEPLPAVIEETASKADLLKQAQQGLIPLTDELIEFWRGAPPDVAALATETGSLTEQLKEMGDKGEVAKDKIAELRTEIEKEEIRARVEFDIAELEQNTERVKAQIQGVVDLAQIRATVDIAEIEAGVEKTRAVLQGLQGVFDVTGNSISELIDAISGVDDADRFARQKIETFQNALDRQITLQEAALESQIKVNDATVRELEARASRLRSGQSLITINGDGLEPELEAFMFRILENIQLRANADGQAFLLGI